MHTLKTQNPGASAEAIQHHYDVGNDFYALWLDSTQTYSCALWEEGDTLESAQLRKIDFHITQARAMGAKRVLDVGCGWGAVLQRLMETYAVEHAVGLTLSKAQVAWCKAKHHPRIDVRLESWSDHVPVEPYDAIVSIGAFEHFARSGLLETAKIEVYRTFFQRCHAWLKPGGWMSLQTIVYENSRPEGLNAFVASEIFPESDPPRLADIAKATGKIFEIVTVRNDRSDYERTCRAWYKRLRENRTAAVRLVGEEVVARYEKYLGVCQIGFHQGMMNLARLTLRRIDHPRP